MAEKSAGGYADFGFDFSEFSDLLAQFEAMGNDVNAIVDKALVAGAEPARQAFIRDMPPNSTTPTGHPHARDNVTIQKPKSSKRTGSRYIKIGAFGSKFVYLWYVEHGHTKAPSHPWHDNAMYSARQTFNPIFNKVLSEQINSYLE